MMEPASVVSATCVPDRLAPTRLERPVESDRPDCVTTSNAIEASGAISTASCSTIRIDPEETVAFSCSTDVRSAVASVLPPTPLGACSASPRASTFQLVLPETSALVMLPCWPCTSIATDPAPALVVVPAARASMTPSATEAGVAPCALTVAQTSPPSVSKLEVAAMVKAPVDDSTTSPPRLVRVPPAPIVTAPDPPRSVRSPPSVLTVTPSVIASPVAPLRRRCPPITLTGAPTASAPAVVCRFALPGLLVAPTVIPASESEASSTRPPADTKPVSSTSMAVTREKLADSASTASARLEVMETSPLTVPAILLTATSIGAARRPTSPTLAADSMIREPAIRSSAVSSPDSSTRPAAVRSASVASPASTLESAMSFSARIRTLPPAP